MRRQGAALRAALSCIYNFLYTLFMKILGIDYGKKRIGIAITDEENKIAFPKVVLENNKNIINEISKFVLEEGVQKIIIGESKDFKMKDNPIMEDIKKFKKTLEDAFGIQIEMFSEVLSSHQAAKMAGNKNDMIDASAAAIILQSYLESL